MDLNSILGALTAGSAVSDMGRQFNMNSNQVNSVITSALPTLIGAMQKNTATESGASSLAGALASHLGDGINLSSASLTDGSKILGHILGSNSNILSAILPMLLGLIGRGQKSTNTGVGGLGGLLGGLLGGGSIGGSLGGNAGGGLLGDKNKNGIPDIIEGFMK